MARRSRFTSDPSDDRGAPLTPDAMTKQEFGRHLQKLLHERNWTQSDLSRAVAEKTGKSLGRDAISTYINGRSYPQPSTVNLLCLALGITRDELFPNGQMNAMDAEHPEFEMKAVPGQPGRAWVRVNRMMSFKSAAKIGELLATEDGASE